MSDVSYQDAIAKFRPHQLSLHVANDWTILLRGKQVTLGSLVLIPKQLFTSFAEIPDSARVSLFDVVRMADVVLRSAFDAEKINLIAAMMKDPFVHFHLIPRYSSDRQFGGLTWSDTDWPSLVGFRDVSTSDEILSEIRSELAPRFTG